VSPLIKRKFYDFIFYDLELIAPIVVKNIAELGYKILILERNNKFGIARKCGNYIENNLLKEIIQKEKPEFILNKINEIVFFNENNIEIKRIKKDLKIIDYELLTRELNANAIKMGIDVQPNTKIFEYNNSNSHIDAIKIKSFRNKYKIKLKYLISRPLYLETNSFSLESKIQNDVNTIYTHQFDIFSCDHNIDQLIIYNFTDLNGSVHIFPADQFVFSVWMINTGQKLNIDDFIREFLDIDDYSIISIYNQEFYLKPKQNTESFNNNIIINVESGLINPLKDYYLINKVNIAEYISNLIKNEKKIEGLVAQKFDKFWSNFSPILL